ncbi:MAG: hypothetical protein JW820_18710 [Spirochaetales bacterium]|nr:hypothetical protein [Spirochaetales bacterium]
MGGERVVSRLVDGAWPAGLSLCVRGRQVGAMIACGPLQFRFRGVVMEDRSQQIDYCLELARLESLVVSTLDVLLRDSEHSPVRAKHLVMEALRLLRDLRDSCDVMYALARIKKEEEERLKAAEKEAFEAAQRSRWWKAAIAHIGSLLLSVAVFVFLLWSEPGVLVYLSVFLVGLGAANLTQGFLRPPERGWSFLWGQNCWAGALYMGILTLAFAYVAIEVLSRNGVDMQRAIDLIGG